MVVEIINFSSTDLNCRYGKYFWVLAVAPAQQKKVKGINYCLATEGIICLNKVLSYFSFRSTKLSQTKQSDSGRKSNFEATVEVIT